MKIVFNKPYISGKEEKHLKALIKNNNFTGDALFSDKCSEILSETINSKFYFTTSCTSALELSALLLNIKLGDEVIVPSYTLSATANAFLLRGAKVVFADSSLNSPNICPNSISELITSKTKAIVIVHYAGISCDMDRIVEIASHNNIKIVEDAAHCIGAYHKNKHLGTLGDFGAISFHETKNLHCGEGGLLICSKNNDYENASLLRFMGTNRSDFMNKKVPNYEWKTVGTSSILSEINLAFLYPQLENLDNITKKRKEIWQKYYNTFSDSDNFIKFFELPFIPNYAIHNAHIFYLKCTNENVKNDFIKFMYNEGVQVVTHYKALHLSEFGNKNNTTQNSLINAEKWDQNLIRLPLFYELNDDELDYIIEKVLKFIKQ